MSKPYRILSFDGGGIRSLLTLEILSLLNKEIDLLSQVQLFAGTSAGSMLAVSLAMGQPLETLASFYEDPKEFLEPSSRISFLHFRNLYTSDSGKRRLKEHLKYQDYTPEDPLSKLKKDVIVTSCTLKGEKGNWHPVTFNNSFRLFNYICCQP